MLLDDRLNLPGGRQYPGSERERFDRERPIENDAFCSWEIEGGNGLVMLPISRQLRYSIPPYDHESWQRMHDLLGWLDREGDDRAIAIYGDDLERAAGVGGWETAHSEHYERFLKWLADNPSIKSETDDWAKDHQPIGKREIEEGAFYELAQSWNAGENYRGWFEDPNCQEHRNYLVKAEEDLIAAEQYGADKGLLELGWKHLLHCSYETAWHNRAEEIPTTIRRPTSINLCGLRPGRPPSPAMQEVVPSSPRRQSGLWTVMAPLTPNSSISTVMVKRNWSLRMIRSSLS